MHDPRPVGKVKFGENSLFLQAFRPLHLPMKPAAVTVAMLAAAAAATADDLLPLSDEFGDPTTLADWQRLNDVEGWNANHLQVWDIDTSAPGHMRLQPHTSSWFDNLRGVLVFKPVAGDFVVTTRLTLYSRRNPAGPFARPVQSFSLAGLFAHGPRGITAAAPDPVPAGDPAWPPPAAGNPGHYTTDWAPFTDNYMFLSFGRAGSFLPNSDDGSRHQYEVKTTRNGDSRLYFAQSGFPSLFQYSSMDMYGCVFRYHSKVYFSLSKPN